MSTPPNVNRAYNLLTFKQGVLSCVLEENRANLCYFWAPGDSGWDSTVVPEMLFRHGGGALAALEGDQILALGSQNKSSAQVEMFVDGSWKKLADTPVSGYTYMATVCTKRHG